MRHMTKFGMKPNREKTTYENFQNKKYSVEKVDSI